MVMEKCKICDHELTFSDTFCPECGFEMHIYPYPEPLSPELKSYEEERVKKYKEQIERQREDQNEKLKKQEDAFNEKMKDQEDAYNEVSSQLSKARDSLKQKDKEIKTAETMALANKQRIAQLEKDLSDALQEAEKSNLSDLKGIVIISDMTDVAVSGVSANVNTPIYRQCLPVLAGINTYGTNRSEGLHHQITIHCRGKVFLPVHFAVDTNHSKGLVIKDLSNGRITLNGNAFKEEYAGNSRFFIKEGRQFFTIEIKSLIL